MDHEAPSSSTATVPIYDLSVPCPSKFLAPRRPQDPATPSFLREVPLRQRLGSAVAFSSDILTGNKAMATPTQGFPAHMARVRGEPGLQQHPRTGARYEVRST